MSWGFSLALIIIGMFFLVQSYPMAAAKLAVTLKRRWRSWLIQHYGDLRFKAVAHHFRAQEAKKGTNPLLVETALARVKDKLVQQLGTEVVNARFPDEPTLLEKLL